MMKFIQYVILVIRNAIVFYGQKKSIFSLHSELILTCFVSLGHIYSLRHRDTLIKSQFFFVFTPFCSCGECRRCWRGSRSRCSKAREEAADSQRKLQQLQIKRNQTSLVLFGLFGQPEECGQPNLT